MTSFKKVSQSQQKWFIQPDDYDLLACPPENLIYNSSKGHKVLLLPNLTLENKQAYYFFEIKKIDFYY